MAWKTLESNILVKSPYICVNRNKVELPKGLIIEDYYTVTVQNSAAVVALTYEEEIVLIKQYRYCYDSDLIELPSGVFEENETDPLKVAKRELLEETGYTSDEWMYLGKTIENPAKMTNYNHIFFARNCKKTADQNLEATEDIKIITVPFDCAVEMVMKNEICCNSTAHGILKAKTIRENNL